mmetsp:Transcript_32157/g.69370  ORF Transcript_32157/g.69370 Transcript_32157/m.69370 type:complete len:328 (+) Transcript_32157:125-1108(+)
MRLTTLHQQQDAHGDNVWACKWVPGGEGEDGGHCRLLTGSVDETCKLWRYEKSQGFNEVQTITKQDLGIVSLDVNGTGEIAASSTLDCLIRIWELDSGNPVTAITLDGPETWSLCFHPNAEQQQLATAAGAKGGVRLYRTGVLEDESQREICHMGPQPSQGGSKSSHHAQKPFALGCVYHPSGTKVACSHSDGHITLYDVEAQKHVLTFVGHSKPVRGLCFSPDGNTLISACDDKTSNLYDVNSKLPIGSLNGHDAGVLCVEKGGEGTHCVTGSSDQTMKVWEIRTRSCVQTVSDHKESVWSISYNPQEKLLASCSDDGSVVAYSVQ